MSPRETRLRELVAHHEWSEPPNMAAADALQLAADAYKAGELSDEAADFLIEIWAPLAVVEARVGNGRKVSAEHAAVRFAVDDLRRMLKEAPTEQKPFIAQKLREQVTILERLEASA